MNSYTNTFLGTLLFVLANCQPVRAIATGGQVNDTENRINSTDGCRLDLQHISRTVPENARIESVIFEGSRPTGQMYSGGIAIVDGNKNGLFRVDDVNGTVYLAKYLDYNFRSVYILLLSAREMAVHGDPIECYLYNITVTVLDVTGWPPYFNETCAWPARKADGYPLPATAYTDYGDMRNFYLSSDPFSNIDSFTLPDLNNDHCDFTIYFLKNIEVNNGYEIGCDDNAYIQNANDPMGVKLLPYSDCRIYQTPDEITADILKILTAHGKRITPLYAITVPYHIFAFAEANRVLFSTRNLLLKFKLKKLGCPVGKYGGLCENDCICQNGALCHAFNGACKCQAGWNGVACDIPETKVTIRHQNFAYPFGVPVLVTCKTYHVNIPSDVKRQGYINGTGVHKWYINGKLIRSKYEDNIFTSEDIEESYSYSSFQVHRLWENCTGKYECRVQDESGKVYSDATYVQISGCQVNMWGEKCDLVCDCVHAVDCDRYSGCRCSPGWAGVHCDQVCPNGTFGVNCSENCLCEDEGTSSCDTVTGRCACADGFCGDLCLEQCSCNSWEQAVCNNDTNGCSCLQVGSRIHGDVTYEGFIVISLLCLTVAVAVVLLICRPLFRRRSKTYQRLDDEEAEISHVIAEHHGHFAEWVRKSENLRLLDTLLGKGHFGQVHKGLYNLPRSRQAEEVAVKTLLPARRTYQCYVDFIAEIKCLIKLYGHPHIVTLKGVILLKDVKCFFMEYAAKGNLLDHVRFLGNKVSTDAANDLLRYILHVTLGMQFMQKKKIIHRDLSSRNILIFDGGVAKISDFGLSRDVSESEGVYKKFPWAEGHGALPLKWMPPEFLTRGVFHFKSDVWSFGVLLWEVCTHGESPFAEVTDYQFTRKIDRGERLGRPDSCSDGAYQIMQKCWQSPLPMRPSAEQLTTEIELLMRDTGLFVKRAAYTNLHLEPFDGILE